MCGSGVVVLSSLLGAVFALLLAWCTVLMRQCWDRVLNPIHLATGQVCAALEWQCFADRVQSEVSRRQAWHLAGYLPYLSVLHHLSLASTAPAKLRYPHQQYEVGSSAEGSVRADCILICLTLSLLDKCQTSSQSALKPVN